jgi:hypothetical protein
VVGGKIEPGFNPGRCSPKKRPTPKKVLKTDIRARNRTKATPAEGGRREGRPKARLVTRKAAPPPGGESRPRQPGARPTSHQRPHPGGTAFPGGAASVFRTAKFCSSLGRGRQRCWLAAPAPPPRRPKSSCAGNRKGKAGTHIGGGASGMARDLLPFPLRRCHMPRRGCPCSCITGGHGDTKCATGATGFSPPGGGAYAFWGHFAALLKFSKYKIIWPVMALACGSLHTVVTFVPNG